MTLSGSHHAVHHRTLRLPLILSVVAGVIVLAVLASVLLTRGGRNDHRALATQSSAPLPATSAVVSSPGSTSAPSVPVSSTSTARPSTPAGPITYVVKPGDNLSVIAAWFQLHGYGALYQANKAVLGDDPSLIHPGQEITISGDGMTTSG